MAVPKIARLLPVYPATITPDALAEVIGGPIGESIKTDHFETCCIRISRALNYSGNPVEGLAAVKDAGLATGRVRAQMGADKKWYIFSTYDLRAYLTVKYGRPKSFPGTSTEDAVKGQRGIIMFGWGHVDLQDGEKVARLAFFADGSVLKDGLFLWPEAS